METDSRMVVKGLRQEVMGVINIDIYRASAGDDDKVLEMDGGGGSQQCEYTECREHLQMVKMVSFMYILPPKKKRKKEKKKEASCLLRWPTLCLWSVFSQGHSCLLR